jgi:multidrug efflux system outer membrane protein
MPLKQATGFNIPASLFGTVAGGITQPIFQRKQLRTQYERAKIDREKTVIEFRQSVLNAVGEVSDELVKIEKLKQQYTIAQSRVGTLQQAVKMPICCLKTEWPITWRSSRHKVILFKVNWNWPA